jgi:hypothetical protein
MGIGCLAANCRVTACAAGYADCNGVPIDGCEVKLDSSNCWSCPFPTPPGGPPPPACPCKPCYAGSMGLISVCPACNAQASTCNPSTMQCE